MGFTASSRALLLALICTNALVNAKKMHPRENVRQLQLQAGRHKVANGGARPGTGAGREKLSTSTHTIAEDFDETASTIVASTSSTSTSTTTTNTNPPKKTVRNDHITTTDEDDTSSSNIITPSIVNGNDAEDGRYPWMAYLYFDNNRDFRCGANLIAANAVLTAAHCFFNYNPDVASTWPEFPTAINLELGQYDLESDVPAGQSYTITAADVVLHPAFVNANTGNPFDGGDFALIFLDPPTVDGNFNVRPLVELNCDMAEPVNEQSVTAIGWGYTMAGASPPANTFATILQQAELSITEFSTCEAAWAPDGITLNESMVCAQGVEAGSGSATDTCTGDSGGPMFEAGVGTLDSPDVLYGLTSFGETSCFGALPAVYSRVSVACPWIAEQLNDCISDFQVGKKFQGCDKADNNCNLEVDECLEDTVAPMISLTNTICGAFYNAEEALKFVETYVVVDDDCVGNLLLSYDVLEQAANYDVVTIRVIAQDPRCNTLYSQSSKDFEFPLMQKDNDYNQWSWEGGSPSKGSTSKSGEWSGGSKSKSGGWSGKYKSGKSGNSNWEWSAPPPPPPNGDQEETPKGTDWWTNRRRRTTRKRQKLMM
jgi:hypothetical protein